MKKHISIKASSCVDMIDAFQSRISELDPSYVASAQTINAAEEGADVVRYPNGEIVPDNSPDMDKFLDYNFGTDRNMDNGSYTTAEKQRAVDYWFKKHEPAPKEVYGADSDNVDTSAVDEAYIDDMMQYVADETVDPSIGSTCSWRVEGTNLIIILASLDSDSVDEYTCPLADLTGDINTDIDYILESVQQ